MENCVIYSHYLAFDLVVDAIKSEVKNAKIDINETSIVVTQPGGFFSKEKTLKVNYRQRLHPSYKLDKIECPVTQNLAGMIGYIESIPAQNNDIRSKLIYKAMAANAEIAFIAEPEFTMEFEAALRKILIGLDAFVFASPNKVFNGSKEQYFADKHLAIILDRKGASQIKDLEVNVDSKYHDPPVEDYTREQLERKAASEDLLDRHGIKVNKNLPCVPDSSSVRIRSVQEVVDRVYALLVLAAKGEGVEQKFLDRTIADKNIASFSPEELILLDIENLTDEQKAFATWRYESLYTLMWALNKTEDLKYPSEICDVSALVGSILGKTREEFESTARLKATTEILDKLDQVYRMNWACVDARIKGQQPGGNIHPGIVYERHYSFNWLTCFEDQDWDNIQTNT